MHPIIPLTRSEMASISLPAELLALHKSSPVSADIVLVISSTLVNIHSLGGLVILQSPCVKFVIVILGVLSLSTIPFWIHQIVARGLAEAVQLNIAVFGDMIVWLMEGIITTGATIDHVCKTR